MGPDLLSAGVIERIKCHREGKGNTQLRKCENWYKKEQRMGSRVEIDGFWAAVIPCLVGGGLR